MFQHGLESLLSQQDGVDIVGRASSPDLALEQIKTLQPDVVIVDSTKSSAEVISKIIRALSDHRDMKVIGLNLHDNHLALYQLSRPATSDYQKLEWSVNSVTDLLKAISYMPAS